MGQGPSPAQIAAAPIDRAQQVVVGDQVDRARIGGGRAHRRAADAPPPPRSSGGEIEAVYSARGGADDDLVVEREDAGGRAVERTRPQRAAGRQVEGDDAAIGQPEVERGERGHRRRVRHAAERRLPHQLAVGGAERRQVAALQRDDEPAGVPVRRGRGRRRQGALPQHAAGLGIERADAAAHRQEHAPVADRGRPRRLGVDRPPDPAGIDCEGHHLAALHRHVDRVLVERRRRRDGLALGGDPAHVEGAAGEKFEAGRDRRLGGRRGRRRGRSRARAGRTRRLDRLRRGRTAQRD